MNEIDSTSDRLYDLLPAVYRQRDADAGLPLQALLRLIAGQVELLEDDVERLYDNWFVETCEDWVVPYLGDLVGYRPVHEAGEPGDPTTAAGAARNRILVPRREVANTVRHRRRKGTLSVLELLARDVAGWPARAVELCASLARTRDVRLGVRVADASGRVLPRELAGRGGSAHALPGEPPRGGSADLRRGDLLDRLGGPFGESFHTADARRIDSPRGAGRYNVPNVALFAWRLRAYPVTATPAYCLEDVGPHCFTFSVLGNDSPLFTRPEIDPDPAAIAGELEVPAPIRRRRLESRIEDFYGPGASFLLWERPPGGGETPEPIAADRLVIADLDGWHYRPRRGQVAIDPVLGRIAFPPRHRPKDGVWVSYHYGFPADVGGGEYHRGVPAAPDGGLYRVGDGEGEHPSLNRALQAWREDDPDEAVIEIARSTVHVEQLNVRLRQGQSLVLRAAERTRPVLRLLDWQTGLPDALTVQVEPEEEAEEGAGTPPPDEPATGDGDDCPGARRTRFVLDGLLVTGRGMMVRGPLDDLEIRHSTLVPGWAIGSDCEPRRPNEPSLELFDTTARVTIERSILGTLQVNQDEVATDPVEVSIVDSVLDATDPKLEALGAPGCPRAHVALTVRRSTLFGKVAVHALDLGENSLFVGRLDVARRQRGCLRFSYVPPGSRTPRRHRCQPDGVRAAVDRAAAAERAAGFPVDEAEVSAEKERETRRVRPGFLSVRYGSPHYCRLDRGTPDEIRRGADDGSEMGVFHHLFEPQRTANLRVRLAEYTPAGMEAGLIFAT
jgi:hypothetical protein